MCATANKAPWYSCWLGRNAVVESSEDPTRRYPLSEEAERRYKDFLKAQQEEQQLVLKQLYEEAKKCP